LQRLAASTIPMLNKQIEGFRAMYKVIFNNNKLHVEDVKHLERDVEGRDRLIAELQGKIRELEESQKGSEHGSDVENAISVD
jgi:hypothetical protein